MKKQLTLTLVHQHPRVLLGMKKRGFGAGRWNGFGGKVESGETIVEGAIREMQEEAGIAIVSPEKVGILDFEFEGDPTILEVHIFRVEEFTGTPRESDEMRPAWFHVDEIPFHEMWADDEFWIPIFLEGKKFTGKVLFDSDHKIINKSFVVEEVLEIA